MRKRYGYVEPKVIMTGVVALMMLAIGVFAFLAVTTGLNESADVSPSGSKCWNIGTPSNPENYTGLPSTTNGISSVTEYFDDGTSASIDSGNYTWSASNPTDISVNVTGG